MRLHTYLRYTSSYGQQVYLQIAGKEPVLMTYVNDEFWKCTIEVSAQGEYYSYFIREPRKLDKNMHGFLQVPSGNRSDITVIDTWNSSAEPANAFFTQAFRKLLHQEHRLPKVVMPKTVTHFFQIKVPVLAHNMVPVLVGSGNELHDWSTHQPIFMQPLGDWWVAQLDLSQAELPITYKYALFNLDTACLERYEDGPNRSLYFVGRKNEVCYVRDGLIRLPVPQWRGSGVAIPVFSLRSKQSFGCGSFTDLKLLADWAASVGMKIIQLLPVNDTSATGTWTDSYPYAAISAFALHPIYADPKAIAGKTHEHLIKPIYDQYQESLAALDEVDYETCLRQKWVMLSALYTAMGHAVLESKAYQVWFEEQKHWLEPYAAFCYLRDRYGTTDFNIWPKYNTFKATEISKLTDKKSKDYQEIALHYFVQYQLHTQLKEATDYANKKGLIVKGDIPIGIYRYSCDAWVAPELYNMDMQAGAPPDDFAEHGQNWGFPTYRWERMKQDNYAWWRSRFKQMSLYFDAFRIDHILGFFRIWSIPQHAVQGILGHFEPAIPVSIGELLEAGIRFDHSRFCEPYINTLVVNEIFGLEAIQALAIFFNRTDDGYTLKPRYTTQRQIEQWYEESEKSETAAFLRDGMYRVIANVILLPVKTPHGVAYHFRYGIEQTSSFRFLDEHSKQQLIRLYHDYFYKRQDALWEREALEKLPALKRATEMLICGEDLGMVPHCVPDVMRSLAILSLEIQRMPKATGVSFFHPKDAPWLSVVTPSTHDMSTIRGWWEEDRELTTRFYKQYFNQQGVPPFFCEPWVNQAIVEQHLASPAMWAIFQLQDLLGIDGKLRRENPHDERINLPSNPKHYWKYRMQLNLEKLQKQKDFNSLLRSLIERYGRA